MDNFEIIPGILEKEWSRIEEKIELVRPFAKTIHVDLLDGIFAPNSTWMDPEPFKKYAGQVQFELHMMVENPAQYVKPFASAGFVRFLGHIEHMTSQQEFVNSVKEEGKEVGFAIDSDTSLDLITVPYEDLDSLLIMTIKAGFSGQVFVKELCDKIRLARTRFEGPIEVDGGINADSIQYVKEAGASKFISTSYLYSSQNPEENYQMLQEKLA